MCPTPLPPRPDPWNRSHTSQLRLPGSARLPVDRWMGLQERMEECAPESEETMRFWEWDRIRRRCGRAIVPPTCAARTQEYVATAETTMPVSVSKGSLTSGINFLEPIGQHPQTEQPTVMIEPRPRSPAHTETSQMPYLPTASPGQIATRSRCYSDVETVPGSKSHPRFRLNPRFRCQ